MLDLMVTKNLKTAEVSDEGEEGNEDVGNESSGDPDDPLEPPSRVLPPSFSQVVDKPEELEVVASECSIWVMSQVASSVGLSSYVSRNA